MFAIYLDNGFFFKTYIDFLATCVQSQDNKCWLRVDNSGIKVEYITDKHDKNRCNIYVFLERGCFKSYVITKNFEICIEPKQIQKLCRNIKKKDKLQIKFDEENTSLKLIIYNDFCGKREEKEIPFSSYYEKHNEEIVEKPQDFYKFPFTVSSDSVQNVKKVVGIKRLSVDLIMLQDKFLIFKGLSQGVSPFVIQYPHDYETELEMNNASKITLSGIVISILSKLTQISKHIHFYQNLDTNLNMLKITAKLDIPYYMGEVEMIVFELGS